MEFDLEGSLLYEELGYQFFSSVYYGQLNIFMWTQRTFSIPGLKRHGDQEVFGLSLFENGEILDPTQDERFSHMLHPNISWPYLFKTRHELDNFLRQLTTTYSKSDKTLCVTKGLLSCPGDCQAT